MKSVSDGSGFQLALSHAYRPKGLLFLSAILSDEIGEVVLQHVNFVSA